MVPSMIGEAAWVSLVFFIKHKVQNWSGREDLNLGPLVPNRISMTIETCQILVFVTD
jgi:hypothetical protein